MQRMGTEEGGRPSRTISIQNNPVCYSTGKHGRRPAWLDAELLTELKHKSEVYRRWQQDRRLPRRNTSIPWAFRDITRKAKAQLEFKVAML